MQARNDINGNDRRKKHNGENEKRIKGMVCEKKRGWEVQKLRGN
jgi:hypothetical protein